MPETAKVLGSNLSRNFFSNWKILFQINLSANYLSAYLLSAWLLHLGRTVFVLLRAFF